MKLESKLGLSTGVLVLAMFASAFTAHMRIQESNRLSAILNDGRNPIISLTRDVRFAPMISIHDHCGIGFSLRDRILVVSGYFNDYRAESTIATTRTPSRRLRLSVMA